MPVCHVRKVQLAALVQSAPDSPDTVWIQAVSGRKHPVDRMSAFDVDDGANVMQYINEVCLHCQYFPDILVC